ncbi:MAG: hypothetical protein LBU23_05420 [Planctomycetota bacterium]|nr:hypothetical protein [Planctomycetota bacterium]
MKKSYPDMDPVEEIRAIRKDIMREFKTLDALCEYLDAKHVITPASKAKTGKKASGHRKPAKRLVVGQGCGCG